VPFLNEESCILHFCEFIDYFARNKPFGVEVIFVDDGSTDETVVKIEAFKFSYCKNIRIVRLSKNFGSHAAIRAGLLHASGDYTTYIGADLEEPDDMVSNMYNNIIDDYDMIFMERNRADHVSLFNRFFSLLYSALIRRFAVRSYGSGGVFCVMMNKTVKDYLNSNIESNSSLILQLLNAGFASKTLQADINKRVAGISKWTFTKKMKLVADSFFSFSYAPIKFVALVGILMSFIGFLYGIIIVINSIIYPDVPAGYPTLASIILIGFGITNISLSIIAEYIWRLFDSARGRPAFIISSVNELK